MFTGIVEEVGSVVRTKSSRLSVTATFGADKVLDGIKLGDSIAVNGMCLTVTAYDRQSFSADITHESIRRTAFSARAGERVNLERALAIGGRLGGHIVSGHIDGVARIANIESDGIAKIITLRAPGNIMRYIVEKGSVAVDGISLTVARATDAEFSVSVIPHTFDNTALRFKRVGDSVNIENDVIGKYIEKLARSDRGITREFLTENGF